MKTLGERIGQLLDTLSRIGGYCAGVIVLGVMSLTLVEVISRYIVRRPLILADEFGAYSMVAIAFLGLAYCWRVGGHVRISFVTDRMPVRVSNWMRVATLAIALVYTGIASKVSYDFIIDASRRAFKSPSYLMVPLMWPQIVIPIGFTLLFLQLLVEIARAARDARARVRIEKAEEVNGS